MKPVLHSYTHILRLYGKLQLQNIRSILQYRADFFLMLGFTLFSQICSLAVIGIIYSNIPQLAGWSLWETLLLYSFLLFSEGSVNFFFQGAWKIAEMINLADLDRFLTRPIPIGLQLLTVRIDFDGLNKMFLATVLFLVAQSHCNIHWTPFSLLLLFFFLAESCMIRTCMIWIASCASFWMEGRTNSLNFLISSLSELAKYPLSIYPFPLRALFGYIVPYAFISFYPIGYLLKKSEMTIGVLLTPLICFVMFLISCFVLRAGLRKYESAT